MERKFCGNKGCPWWDDSKEHYCGCVFGNNFGKPIWQTCEKFLEFPESGPESIRYTFSKSKPESDFTPFIEVTVPPDEGESFLAGHFLNSIAGVVSYYEHKLYMPESEILRALELYCDILEDEI